MKKGLPLLALVASITGKEKSKLQQQLITFARYFRTLNWKLQKVQKQPTYLKKKSGHNNLTSESESEESPDLTSNP